MWDFFPESKPRPQSPLPQSHKPLPKPAPPPVNRSTVTSPPPSYNSKVALIPPGKQAVKPPPLPPPKPTHKPLSPRPPPLPPPKPRTPSSTSITDQSPHANGIHSFASSLLLSPDGHKAPTDIGEACLENEFEVGSLVEVNDPPIFGVICWIGHISGISEHVAGIELVSTLSGLFLKIFINSIPTCNIRKLYFLSICVDCVCVSGSRTVCRNRWQLPGRTLLSLSS